MSNVTKSKSVDSKEQTAREAMSKGDARLALSDAKEATRQRYLPKKSNNGKGNSIDTASISFDPNAMKDAIVPNQIFIIVEAYYDLCDALKLEYGKSVKVIELQNSISSDVWKFRQDVTVVLGHYRKMISGDSPWRPKQDATVHAIGKVS